ncbi:hypothetical protein D9M71_411390 [compost metagenome]
MSTAQQKPGRKLLHTRQVVCHGYEREDGLFDIEARMQDITPVHTELPYRSLEAGGDIHDMHMSITIDQQMVIRHACAHTAAWPTPFCPEITAAYASLAGEKIGPGFTQRVKTLFSGAQGCTHLTELLGPMATTAYQMMFALQRATIGPMPIPAGSGPMKRPKAVDSCYALREAGEPAARIWPLDRRQLIASE